MKESGRIPARRVYLFALVLAGTALVAARAVDRAIEQERLSQFIRKNLGVPYLWGGCTGRGYDCSGFVMRAFQDQGFILPRTSHLQSLCGERVERSKADYGDLLFFDTKGGGRVTHVGIQLEENKFAHASKSQGITVSSRDSSYWKPRLLFAARIARGRNYLKESGEKLETAPPEEKKFDLREAYIVGLEGFLSPEEALQYQLSLLEKGYDAFITYGKNAEGKDSYRVGIGFFSSEKEAAEFIMKDEYIQGLVYYILKQVVTEGDGA